MTTQEPMKQSVSDQRKIYYQKNREQILARQKRYNETHRDVRAEYFKQYYNENKQKINQRCMERSFINYWKDVQESRARAVQYYRNNIDHNTIVRRAYQEENREYINELAREHNKKYRRRSKLRKNGAIDLDLPIGESLVIVKLNPIVVFD